MVAPIRNQTAAWMQSLGRATGSGNQTVDWLRRIGRGDIAEKVASGSLPAGQALTLVSGAIPQDPQGPSYAPGATQGSSGQVVAPPLGGDEQQVGRPFPNEPLPQMGATPAAPDAMPWRQNRIGFVDMPVEADYGVRPPNSAMDRFQNMTVQEREAYLNGLNGGASQPAGTGGPERVYQAQATAGDQPQIPGYNFDDNVTDRRLAGQELDYRTALGRLESIDQQLAENPELLEGMTFSGNLRRQGLAFWERLGFDLSDDSEEYLSDQTAFRQSILRNINRTIQEVTGAQMGEQEARRIRAEMPDVTASPTEFRTQLGNAMNMIRMDAARVQVWRMGGSEGEASSVTDADVMQALRERGASAYQEALQQGLSTSEARLQAARMLREEFGL